MPSSYYDTFLSKYQELARQRNWKQPLLSKFFSRSNPNVVFSRPFVCEVKGKEGKNENNADFAKLGYFPLTCVRKGKERNNNN